MHQNAYHQKTKTIHSSAQIKHFKSVIDDRAIKVGGAQQITTLENCKILISIRSALAYIPLRLCSDDQWEKLPYVILTSDKE